MYGWVSGALTVKNTQLILSLIVFRKHTSVYFFNISYSKVGLKNDEKSFTVKNS